MDYDYETYKDLSRKELIELVAHYEFLTNNLIEKVSLLQSQQVWRAESEDDDEMTSFEAKMLKILEWYIKHSASGARGKAWGDLFNNFGFKDTLAFAGWGSSKRNSIEVKGAKEIKAVFSGQAEPSVLKQAGISPKTLFTSIRWRR
jgi:hypothetical protein